MGSQTTPLCRDPTTALRLRSPDRLQADLERLMVNSEADVEIDFRDVLVGFAPFFDCAQRLGIDPVGLFDAASVDCSPALRDLASTFARRSDVTLEAFGYGLDELPDGPCYRPKRYGSIWQLRKLSASSASGDIPER